MDTVTYPDHRVADFLQQHFVAAKLPVKQNRPLVEDYLVSWTPNVVIGDERGRAHYRVEGYCGPEDFVARLSLGLGKYWLNRHQFRLASERFEEVAQRHAGSDAGAEALYWHGVAQYKESDDAARLRESWRKLASEYP